MGTRLLLGVLEELAQLMKNYTRAEIEGFVKSATSFAFNRHVKVGTFAGISDDVENLRVNRSDFFQALEEIKPAFGTTEEEIQEVIQNGIIEFDSEIHVRRETLVLRDLLRCPFRKYWRRGSCLSTRLPNRSGRRGLASF